MGPLHSQTIYLGHSFLTDLLLLRIELCLPLAYNPRDPWLQDALRSFAEALSLAASLRLDIDPGELSAGYRLLPPNEEHSDALALVDIYLFDTASGGAGYAAEAGDLLSEILEKAAMLLSGCPGQCERSCTKCLRHYGNRYWHKHLDRHLALQLLRYVERGEVPSVLDAIQQSLQLESLQRFLELEGWHSEQNVKVQGIQVPLLVTIPNSLGKAERRVAVGIYPALLEQDHAKPRHQLHNLEVNHIMHIILLKDYIVARDLPTTYKYFLKNLPL